MNRLFKKHFWLTVVIIFMTAPDFTHADDLFDDSFFANPAPVDAVKPADPAPAPAAAPATAPAALPDAPAAVPAPSPVPAPSMDLPAPTADLSVPPPPPPAGNASFSGFGMQDSSNVNMAPANEQLLGKISSDVFREMVEMEKENNTLKLQLQREQLRSAIDELKSDNRQKLFDEIERREKMTQARLEWELAQDLKRQEALERKQRAEIRQKQIEAVLKREEERRIQKMKDEELARQKREEEIKKEKEQARLKEEEKKAELRKKYDAISFAQVKGLQPTLIAATRPAKIKRTASSRVSVLLSSMGEDLLAKKKAGEALTTETENENAEEEKREPASALYAVKEIRGAGGTLIAKLVSKKDTSTFYAKKSTILPTGHTVISIDKDFVMLQIGKNREMIGFSAAGILSEGENTSSGSSNNDYGYQPPPETGFSGFTGAVFSR